MKTILVTGGNRGIGFEICRQLHALGYKVIMGSRDIEKGNIAAHKIGEGIVVKQVDVTSESSIQQLFEFVVMNFEKIDVLINNAGIGELSYNENESLLYKAKVYMEKHIIGVKEINKMIVPHLRKARLFPTKISVQNVPLSTAKQIMETNFYGAWRMSQIFIPLLENSPEGRIINISSGMGEISTLDGLYPGYRISKVALNALTIMLAKDLAPKGIKVNAMCPGWVKTRLGGVNAPLSVSQGADTAVWLVTEKVIETGKFFRDRKEINW